MSFILDALARQHGLNGPGAANPANRVRALWRLAVTGIACVLFVALCGASLYAVRAKRAAPSATPASGHSQERIDVAAVDVPTMAPRPPARASEPASRPTSPASAASANRVVALARDVPRFSPPTTLSQPLPNPSPLGPGGAFAAVKAPPAAAVQRVTTETPHVVSIADLKPLSVLAPDMRATLAQMKVRVLFYAPQPRSRFVMIDGRELREGDELFTGLRLEEITDTGMVLRHKNMLVLSPATPSP